MAHEVRQIPALRAAQLIPPHPSPILHTSPDVTDEEEKLPGKPFGFITSLSVRDHNKEKGAAQGRLPEPEAKQRTKKCQPIQILLCAPRTSVIRMDFLDLTIANAGVTLYLDKDWYSDLYENRDTSIRMVFCFKHG